MGKTILRSYYCLKKKEQVKVIKAHNYCILSGCPHLTERFAYSKVRGRKRW